MLVGWLLVEMSLLGQDVSFFTGSEECWEGWIKCRILSWDSKLPRPPQDLWTRKSSAATQIPLSGRELHWKIGNKRKQWWQGRGHCVHNAAWGENLCLWPGCYTNISMNETSLTKYALRSQTATSWWRSCVNCSPDSLGLARIPPASPPRAPVPRSALGGLFVTSRS